MELLLGSHVREHRNRVGRLAGFELEPTTLRVRRLIFSPDGELGPQAMTRPLNAVSLVHDDGEVELRPDIELQPMPATSDVVLLSRSTRLTRAGREAGRFVGVDINAAEYSITAVFGRHHWWSRRFSLPAGRVDFTSPGEIRTSNDSRAA
jgi:hypothetical protein